MSDEEGAKPSEVLIEAARRNNTELLNEIFQEFNNNQQELSKLINKSIDPLGNTALHIGAINGSFQVIDELLDIEGVEVDPINRLQGDTPLHCAVRYSQQEAGQDDDLENAKLIIDTLIDAGCDARIKNKDGQKPIDLVSPGNDSIRKSLESGEMAMLFGSSLTAAATQDDDEAGSGGDETPSDDDE